MSIRELARELYRLQLEVEGLEERLKRTPPSERDVMEDRLRRVRAERDRLSKILQSKKEPPPYRKPV